jgi:acid phosphatase type 7
VSKSNLREHAMALVACSLILFWGSAAHAVNPRPPFARMPYLQFATPTSIHVVWRTEGPIQPVVRWGLSPQELDACAPVANIVVRASLGANGQAGTSAWASLRTPENLGLPKLHSAPLGTFQYEAKLTGLRSATKYHYAVYDGERRLTPTGEPYTFVTPPEEGARAPTRFWVLGDSGTGRQPQRAVHLAMRRYVERTGKPLDFWIHVGDMAYGDGRDTQFQSRFFESYEETLSSSVCWPTMGNHEGHTSRGETGIGPYYDAYVVPTRGEAGGLASGTEAYYSFDHANIHFICLDSHDLDRRPTGAMAKWLRADLELAKADWVIAFWHHPPYTKGSHDSEKEKDLTEMRQYIMPILESEGVDVVLTGHSHIYERSMMMDGAYGAATTADNNILDDGDGDPAGDGAYQKSEGVQPHEGTVQVVAGHGGASLGRHGTLPIFKRTIAEHGSVIFDVRGDTLTAVMLNHVGQERDLFQILKRGQVTPVRIALPWKPADSKFMAGSNPPAAPPVDYQVLIPRHAEWIYLFGAHPQGKEWCQLEFPAKGWSRGAAPFGFGHEQLRTMLERPRNGRAALYLRRELTVRQADRVTEMGLIVNYQDGFIAYLNGGEVLRRGVGRSSGRNVQEVTSRATPGEVYVSLSDPHEHLRDGLNVLAIEVHSAGGESLDFLIDPVLILED